jgi:hypothetical protein
MKPRSCVWLKRMGWSGLLLALLGCGRSAGVVAPEDASAGEPLAPHRTARGQSDDSEGKSFTFPDDAGGALLAKALSPKEPMPPPRPERVVSSRRTSVFRKPPTLPLPPSHAALPQLPVTASLTPLRPRLVVDETLVGFPEMPLLPQSLALPDGGRIRVPSRDVNEPIPLPILARPVTDRASLEDPTQDASSAAAVAATIPARTSKAPFLKTMLPDPYDRRRTDTPSEEESREFPIGTPRTPR